MSSQQPQKSPTEDTRRDFIRGSSMLLAAALPTRGVTNASSGSSIRVGLIGCGRRGVTLALEGLNSSVGKIEIAALADVFSDRVHQAYRTLKGRCPQAVTAQPEQRFVGLDAFERLLDSDVDLVILATPPYFRPEHFETAIAKRKHVFSEKPIAVDVPGVRRFSEAGQKALDLGLCVAVGKHRQLTASPPDGRWTDLRSQLRKGIIGDLVSIELVSVGRSLSKPTTMRQGSELDHQLRNWQQHEWLGGDPMLEQQIHLLDIANDLIGSCPEVATAEDAQVVLQGPSARVRYAYSGGRAVLSTYVVASTSGACSQQFEIFGTSGRCDLLSRKIFDKHNRQISPAAVSTAAPRTSMDELIDAIQSSSGWNEYRSAADSTLTAIMGQLALQTSMPQTWAECSQKY